MWSLPSSQMAMVVHPTPPLLFRSTVLFPNIQRPSRAANQATRFVWNGQATPTPLGTCQKACPSLKMDWALVLSWTPRRCHSRCLGRKFLSRVAKAPATRVGRWHHSTPTGNAQPMRAANRPHVATMLGRAQNQVRAITTCPRAALTSASTLKTLETLC